jgi:hypothetical protein
MRFGSRALGRFEHLSETQDVSSFQGGSFRPRVEWCDPSHTQTLVRGDGRNQNSAPDGQFKPPAKLRIPYFVTFRPPLIKVPKRL